MIYNFRDFFMLIIVISHLYCPCFLFTGCWCTCRPWYKIYSQNQETTQSHYAEVQIPFESQTSFIIITASPSTNAATKLLHSKPPSRRIIRWVWMLCSYFFGIKIVSFIIFLAVLCHKQLSEVGALFTNHLGQYFMGCLWVIMTIFLIAFHVKMISHQRIIEIIWTNIPLSLSLYENRLTTDVWEPLFSQEVWTHHCYHPINRFHCWK